jgi:thiol:disulfide interchange protein DsbC
MLMRFRFVKMLFAAAGLATVALAARGADEGETKAREALQRFLPGVEADSVRTSGIPGLYEASFGTRVLYVTGDGKYAVFGDIVATADRRNLTEARRGELINKLMANLPENEMIVIAPTQAKRSVTVFTDVDCPYCAKFHRDVPALNEAGVKVRYLLFPRTGVGSESYHKAVSVWCSGDRVKTVGIAKAGGKVEPKKCDNPVEKHMELGAEIGIQGTPAIVLDNGKMLPGYVPAVQLLAQLGLAPAKATSKTP